MNDQEQRFMEILEDIKLLAQTNGNVLNVEEVKSVFLEEGIKLTDEQLALVQDYLTASRVEFSEKEETAEMEEADKETAFFELYKRDLQGIHKYTNEELEKMALDVQANKEALTEVFLRKVVRWAESYKKYGLPMNDLVQEGNLGLLQGIADFHGEGLAELTKHLKKRAVQSMEAFIAQQESERDTMAKILFRVNAVNDCARKMSKELMRKVFLSELCDKLNMTKEEVLEVQRLSGNKLSDIDWTR